MEAEYIKPRSPGLWALRPPLLSFAVRLQHRRDTRLILLDDAEILSHRVGVDRASGGERGVGRRQEALHLPGSVAGLLLFDFRILLGYLEQRGQPQQVVRRGIDPAAGIRRL